MTRVSSVFVFPGGFGADKKREPEGPTAPSLVRRLIGAFCGLRFAFFFCGDLFVLPGRESGVNGENACYGCSIMGRLSTYSFERVKRCLDLLFWCVEPVRASFAHRWLYGRYTRNDGQVLQLLKQRLIADTLPTYM